MCKFTTSAKKTLPKLTRTLFRSRYLLVALTIMTGLTYVWQVNSLSTYGYNLKELEKNLQHLKKENKILENKLASLGSMDQVQAKVDSLAFNSVEKIEYINPTNNVIAQK